MAYTSTQQSANDGDAMINIRYEPNDVVARIPKDLAATAYVQGFLEHLRVEAALERSQITDAQIEELSEQVKSDWWTAKQGGIFEGIIRTSLYFVARLASLTYLTVPIV